MEQPMLILVKELLKVLYEELGEETLMKLFSEKEAQILLDPRIPDASRFTLFKGRLTETLLLYTEKTGVTMLNEIHQLSIGDSIAIFNMYFVKSYVPFLKENDVINLIY